MLISIFYLQGHHFWSITSFLQRESAKKIQKAYPKKKDYWREIFLSTLSIIIFSFPPLFMLYNDSIQPHTTFYTDISEYGWVYSILAFPLMLLVHDTYFFGLIAWCTIGYYLKHFILFIISQQILPPGQLMPFTLWKQSSFIFVPFLFTIPIHSIHLTLFFIFRLVYNVYGHLGFELYPKGFNRRWLGKYLNTSTWHNQHPIF